MMLTRAIDIVHRAEELLRFNPTYSERYQVSQNLDVAQNLLR